ncbi:hypothetical protein [Ferruginibacter sp. SUN106]|uniref:hypothetical protein n=1 Tax=Ferruginibacter sp. SUN106 TaxID=2978348 RepID=UPI003D361BB3
MKLIFIVLLSILTTSSFAQTKAIAFKSHSGNMNNFSIALEHGLFSNEESNFGLPSSIKTYRLDSVIYVSEEVSVIVYRFYNRRFNEPKDSAKFIRSYKDSLFNDPLFSKKHALDSIKTVLKKTGRYDYPINNAVFVGYDNKKKTVKEKTVTKPVDNTNKKPKENNITPVITNNNDNSPFDMQMVKALAGIFLLALLGGWLSWKYAGYRNKKSDGIADQLTVA